MVSGVNPVQLKQGIEKAVEDISEKLLKMSIKIKSSTEMAQVGTVASNGDTHHRVTIPGQAVPPGTRGGRPGREPGDVDPARDDGGPTGREPERLQLGAVGPIEAVEVVHPGADGHAPASPPDGLASLVAPRHGRSSPCRAGHTGRDRPICWTAPR